MAAIEIFYLVRCGEPLESGREVFLERDGLRHVSRHLAPRMTLVEAKAAKVAHDADSGGFPTAVIVEVAGDEC